MGQAGFDRGRHKRRRGAARRPADGRRRSAAGVPRACSQPASCRHVATDSLKATTPADRTRRRSNRPRCLHVDSSMRCRRLAAWLRAAPWQSRRRRLQGIEPECPGAVSGLVPDRVDAPTETFIDAVGKAIGPRAMPGHVRTSATLFASKGTCVAMAPRRDRAKGVSRCYRLGLLAA